MRRPNKIRRHRRVPPAPCPVCTKIMDTATCVTEVGAQPRPGMATMCLYCGAICIFTRTMALRLMKPFEHKKWAAEHPGLFERMEAHRQKIVATKPSRYPSTLQ